MTKQGPGQRLPIGGPVDEVSWMGTDVRSTKGSAAMRNFEIVKQKQISLSWS